MSTECDVDPVCAPIVCQKCDFALVQCVPVELMEPVHSVLNMSTRLKIIIVIICVYVCTRVYLYTV